MTDIKNIMALNKDELIEALLYSARLDALPVAFQNNIKEYYKLCSIDELRAKAEEWGGLYKKDEAFQKVTERELKRREYVTNKPKPIKVSKTLNIPAISSSTELSSAWKMVNEMLHKRCVRDAVYIAFDAVGIRIEEGEDRERVKRIAQKCADRIGYKGDIVYG